MSEQTEVLSALAMARYAGARSADTVRMAHQWLSGYVAALVTCNAIDLTEYRDASDAIDRAANARLIELTAKVAA